MRSQLLYVACRPIFVRLRLLNQEEIFELQRDPSKYKSPIRQIPRPRPRALKRRYSAIRSNNEMTLEPQMDQGDEVIVIDDEEIVPEGMTMATLTPIGSASGSVQSRSKSLPISRSMIKRHRSKAKHSRSAVAIMVVDLCSSDEEENSIMRVSTDENKDPMDCLEPETSISRTYPSSKCCPKPCIYPADSMNNRFAGNNLTAENDNRGNKCLSDVLKHSCTPYTPILRQTP